MKISNTRPKSEAPVMAADNNHKHQVKPSLQDMNASLLSPDNNDYVCVHCSTPCAALYRHLSVSLSSIKAMTCGNCEQLVDPYIEQEWLLVAIDCMLLREEAYRHVLHNVDELKELPVQTLVQLLFGWSLLDGYLKWETTASDDEESPYNNDGNSLPQREMILQLAVLSITSTLGLLFQLYTMILFQGRQGGKRGNDYKIFWALILPSSFSIVTIFVNIWENAKTVRMLSSLLIAYWQGIAIWVVTDGLSTPLLGLAAGILWRLLVSLVSIQPAIFFDLEVKTLGEYHRIYFT